MDRTALTVYFEDPFWVGVFAREEDGGCSACRVVFGGEPRDAEVYDLIVRRFHTLRFGPAVPAPPRERREGRRSRSDGRSNIGTKAQQALSAQREQNKLQRQERTKAQREEEQARKFALRQAKKREKRKGH